MKPVPTPDVAVTVAVAAVLATVVSLWEETRSAIRNRIHIFHHLSAK